MDASSTTFRELRPRAVSVPALTLTSLTGASLKDESTVHEDTVYALSIGLTPVVAE